ncbi:uncharacterized protein AC631_02284 [Debaryomyces fabryi]|uniref:Protein MSS2, mitochondrial n=1 Tax=Debaryomyces fabryi TaxID=58627 RepID=A0A0V1Q0K4_9ASCO|nr:uncharacterized protein AC631_02284 [Debaryomyces fabryi]KSA01993.1 hypothetical protein AC631_02284 [Debaryomyces fabryi]
MIRNLGCRSKGLTTALKIRWNSSSTQNRPELLSLLPGKRTINKILFDNDSRLSYKKVIPILDSVYSNIETPENIILPKYVKSNDLMLCKQILASIRSTTNSINKNLVLLENELVEQAAELGNNDAITILAFESIENKETSKEDYKYANTLIDNLTKLKHPLVFKMAGDLAFKKGYHNQAEVYWLQFIELELNTILASQVYANLGIYYFNYLKPRPDLTKAELYLKKSIKFGELDKYTIQAHYYLGQLYSMTDPILSKYHLEISASKGLKESFPSLGFLEMNIFKNYSKSLEWFKLGVESSNDLSCMIGQFDCFINLENLVQADGIYRNLVAVHNKINAARNRKNIPKDMQKAMETNESLLNLFFTTRSGSIKSLPSYHL